MGETIWTLFFLAIAFQGIFLGFILMTRKKMVNGNKLYLGLFIILFSIILLFWVGFWKEFPFKYAHFNYLYTPIPFLIGPVLFFYVKSFYKRISIVDFFHFIPFILTVFYFMPLYILEEGVKIEILKERSQGALFWRWDIFNEVFSYLSLFFFVLYSFLIYYFIKYGSIKYKIAISEYCKKWLYLINFLFVVFTLFLIVSDVSVNLFDLSLKTYYFNALIISLIIYIIGYIGLNHTKYVIALETSLVKKYKRSGLSSDDAPEYIESIIQYIEEEKAYLNEDFKIKNLSEAVKIPTHHISELLNTYHSKNFSELINSYRVKDAKELLVSKDYDNKTVSAVGYDVGFNSRTTFYHWFKKITGQSPATYQKSHK